MIQHVRFHKKSSESKSATIPQLVGFHKVINNHWLAWMTIYLDLFVGKKRWGFLFQKKGHDRSDSIGTVSEIPIGSGRPWCVGRGNFICNISGNDIGVFPSSAGEKPPSFTMGGRESSMFRMRLLT